MNPSEQRRSYKCSAAKLSDHIIKWSGEIGKLEWSPFEDKGNGWEWFQNAVEWEQKHQYENSLLTLDYRELKMASDPGMGLRCYNLKLRNKIKLQNELRELLFHLALH